MFNSPLHFCKVCKQYVELDQSVEQCAREHGCRSEACPYASLFRPPAPTDEAKPADQDRPLKP
jgi:hypothetical protein